MQPEQCREWRGALGAAALGRLEPAEAIALQAHLDGCPECRAELHELEGIAQILPYADADRVGAPDQQPPPELGALVVARVVEVRDDRRWRRFGRALAVAAAVIVVIAVATTVVVTRAGDDATRITLSGAEYQATAELRGVAAGTEVRFHGDGLDDGDWYWLWITDEDGDRVSAGTFQGSAEDIDVTLTAALPFSDTRRVWVTDADDAVVLDAHL